MADSKPIDLRSLVTAKSVRGAAVGALIGGVLGDGPWGAAIGAVLGGAALDVAPGRRKATMTAEREGVFRKALASKDPAELRAYADEFEREGARAQAKVLRAKAAARELPESVKGEHRRVFLDALSWDKPEDVEKLAGLYEKQCAFLAAKTLRLQAAAVRAAQEAKASGKAAPTETSDALRASLVEVVKQFGADSEQTRNAATTYLRAAHGSEPDEAAVQAEIVAAEPPKATPASEAAA